MSNNSKQFQQSECVFLLRTKRSVSKIDRIMPNGDWYNISMYDLDENGEPTEVRTSITSGAGAREYMQDLLTVDLCDDVFE